MRVQILGKDPKSAIQTAERIPLSVKPQIETRPDYLSQLALAYYSTKRTDEGNRMLDRAMSAALHVREREDDQQVSYVKTLRGRIEPDVTGDLFLRERLSNAFGLVVDKSAPVKFVEQQKRHDLNRLPGPAAFDQYDRPLYAPLVKEGSLLVAAPTATRRFSGFEMVSALDADGSSAYRGVTAEILA